MICFLSIIHPWWSESIKNMEWPLIHCNWHYSWFLQKVAPDVCSIYCVVFPEEYLHKFAKPTRVVIPDCFAVPKCLQQRVTRQNLLFQRVILLLVESGEQLHAVLRWLCFTSPTLPWNHYGLFLATLLHKDECLPCNNEYMWFLIPECIHQYLLPNSE